MTVAGIAAPCVGQSMTVTLTGASNASLGEVTKVVTGTSDAVNFDTATTPQLVLAEAVTGVHVVITGTPAA